jgi:epidermal growth factor receptor substrate 15
MSTMSSAPAASGFTSSTMGSAFSQNRSNQQWDVTSDAKATSDRFFAQLDQQNRGTIEGDVAVPFMLQSQLDEGTLATIW